MKGDDYDVSHNRSERERMSEKERAALRKRMAAAIKWGISDKDFRERFGRPRGEVVAILKLHHTGARATKRYEKHGDDESW